MNNSNYLFNVKNVVKLLLETSKGTKLCFSSTIYRIDIKDVDGRINEINSHLENCCKQQNLGFIKSCIINKSGHTAKGLNLNERESSESGEHFIEYVY